jgi:DNA-binding LytR/AlgR family response regulator
MLRERGPAWCSGQVGPASFLHRHRLSWAIAAAAAVLLGGVGAFGTDHAPPLILYGYWLGMMFASALVFALLRDRLEARPGLAANPPALALALVVGVAAAMTPVVLVVAALVLGGSARPGRLVTLFPQALLIAAAFVALQWVLERKGLAVADPLPATRPSRPGLLDRLPEKLRGGELHAIEAEDHYLRVHTDLGSALVLMRLGDALEELGGLAGAQTHRSWWVAREAVVGVARGRGRAMLTLKGGLQVPVSRTYARSLRQAGWF